MSRFSPAGGRCPLFVVDHAATYAVKRLCELLELPPSSYYAWLDAAPARAERTADYAALAEELGVRLSVGRTGSCHGNAVAESWFTMLKNEMYHRQ